MNQFCSEQKLTNPPRPHQEKSCLCGINFLPFFGKISYSPNITYVAHIECAFREYTPLVVRMPDLKKMFTLLMKRILWTPGAMEVNGRTQWQSNENILYFWCDIFVAIYFIVKLKYMFTLLLKRIIWTRNKCMRRNKIEKTNTYEIQGEK